MSYVHINLTDAINILKYKVFHKKKLNNNNKNRNRRVELEADELVKQTLPSARNSFSGYMYVMVLSVAQIGYMRLLESVKTEFKFMLYGTVIT